MTGGKWIGGLTIGGSLMGPLGVLGCLFFGLPQEPQPRMEVAEEMKIMQMKRRAGILVESMFNLLLCARKKRETQSER